MKYCQFFNKFILPRSVLSAVAGGCKGKDMECTWIGLMLIPVDVPF